VWAEDDHGAIRVLTDRDGGASQVDLDTTGSRVWVLIDGQTTIAGIAKRLVDQIGPPRSSVDHVTTSVVEFTSRLEELGLVAVNARAAS
jgi:hypothetical protein